MTSRHQHGFALLSLLLALALGGALLYGYYELVHRQRHLDDAKVLALRLVQYNAAVAQRILDELASFPTFPIPPASSGPWTGVAWLQNSTACTAGAYTPPTGAPADRTYLPCDFPARWPYALGPHSTATITASDVQVTTTLVDFGTTTPALPEIGGADHAVAAARTVRHALTLLGPGPTPGVPGTRMPHGIHQDVFLFPVAALPPTEIHAIARTHGGAPELYLRVDGSNEMQADLTFDVPAAPAARHDVLNVRDVASDRGGIAFMGNLAVGDVVDKWECPTGLSPAIQVVGIPQFVPGTTTEPLAAWQFNFLDTPTPAPGTFTLRGQYFTTGNPTPVNASTAHLLRVAVIGQCTTP